MSAPTFCRDSFEAYCAIQACNWSTLREATKSGLAYQHRLANPPAETDAMRLGRATHTAVFEPDRLLLDYVIWEGGRRAGKDWEAFSRMHTGKTILRPEDYTLATNIRDVVRGHERVGKLLAHGSPECSITWTDQETGLPCKARLDWLGPGYILDLKTTRTIEQRAFGRHFADMLYHGQFAFYTGGLRALGQDCAVKIIAVEQAPPHDVALYELDEDVLWAGEAKVREALRTVAACRERGEWQGRYPDPLGLLLPPWEYPNDEDEIGIIVGGKCA